uniref:Putative retrotransposon protein n=1 Tax=Zea mays TaxID=4577 RepID=Q7XBD1_MAIZE|nr:putative retrotransposon protein [Zea mays]
MAVEKKVVNPTLAGFYEAMEKTNTEKITNEILAGLSEDSGDSESFDLESGNEDAEDRPWRPSHTMFGKSTIKQSRIDAMKGRYFRDISIVRAAGDSTAPAPEVDEVVVYRSFMKAGLQFSLSKFLVEVLKTFEIYLHQITPEAIIRMGIFIWAMRSQGLEPSAKCFCNMHELFYETKATGKEQYHNNFGCYGFVPRSDVSYPVPTFRKRWPGAWMEEWFYVKNNLVEREDIKGIIQCTIWCRFGISMPATALGNEIEACQKAFNSLCTFIGTRDLVQEHIAYRGKKRKAIASAISATPKGKKIKNLTHRPRYIETTSVPKLTEGPSSAVEPELPAPAEATTGSAEELILKTAAEQTEAEIADVLNCPAEAKAKTTEKP